MSAADIKRFTCNGCGKIVDCTEDDFRAVISEGAFARPKGDDAGAATALDTPFGWIRIHAEAVDRWRGLNADLIKSQDFRVGHACSVDCAAKALTAFAASLKDRLTASP